MRLKLSLLILLEISVSGCGTINTTFRDDMVASNKLANWQSHCDSVPRVYSGAAFDYCTLNAAPRRSIGFDGYPAAPLIVLDMGLSGIADTFLLPYTIYLQNKYGNIEKAKF